MCLLWRWRKKHLLCDARHLSHSFVIKSLNFFKHPSEVSFSELLIIFIACLCTLSKLSTLHLSSEGECQTHSRSLGRSRMRWRSSLSHEMEKLTVAQDREAHCRTPPTRISSEHWWHKLSSYLPLLFSNRIIWNILLFIAHHILECSLVVIFKMHQRSAIHKAWLPTETQNFMFFNQFHKKHFFKSY